jgi:hypothetical protein
LEFGRRKWWKKKNTLVDEFLEEYSQRAMRPVAVRESALLREEALSEKHGEDDEAYRARNWSSVLREFLTWYNDYRWMHLRFRDPDGNLVRSNMPNSHQPGYGDIYYARLKALERQVLEQFENPHIALLTFTGSTKNGNGGWRCPADHLRDVVDPFGSNVRPALHRALSHVDQWEYAKVLEHHKSGYGHMHVAVFVDGEVSEADFRPAIDAHLQHCEIAHRDAHDYYAEETEARPISVNSLDTDLDPEDYDDAEDVIGNLASYVAEYIGSHGKELFDRSIGELMFRAASWATGTQRVTFSPGANELIEEDRDVEELESGDLDEVPPRWKPGIESADIEAAASDPECSASDLMDNPEQGWQLDGVGIVDDDGESRFEVKHSGVEYGTIEGAEHLDPPNPQPSGRPEPRTTKCSVLDY